ncbi:hypothetical protein [Methanobrevibacter sp. DSM 116169]
MTTCSKCEEDCKCQSNINKREKAHMFYSKLNSQNNKKEEGVEVNDKQ